MLLAATTNHDRMLTFKISPGIIFPFPPQFRSHQVARIRYQWINTTTSTAAAPSRQLDQWILLRSCGFSCFRCSSGDALITTSGSCWRWWNNIAGAQLAQLWQQQQHSSRGNPRLTIYSGWGQISGFFSSCCSHLETGIQCSLLLFKEIRMSKL